MIGSRVRFDFNKSIPMSEVEATLRLALLAVQSLHGEDRLRLEAHVSMNHSRRMCFVDTTTEVGRTLALIFAGYIRREFGDAAYGMQTLSLTRSPAGSAT